MREPRRVAAPFESTGVRVSSNSEETYLGDTDSAAYGDITVGLCDGAGITHAGCRPRHSRIVISFLESRLGLSVLFLDC